MHTGAANYHQSCFFLRSHILLQRQVSSSHMPLLFEICRNSARCCWKERKKRKNNVKPPVCGHYCGRSDSVPSQEAPWLCCCHHYGRSKFLQPSEINTSWPAVCCLSLDEDSRLIWCDRTCDLSQQSLGVLTALGHFQMPASMKHSPDYRWLRLRPRQGDFHKALTCPDKSLGVFTKHLSTSTHGWTLCLYYPDTLKHGLLWVQHIHTHPCRICSANNW